MRRALMVGLLACGLFGSGAAQAKVHKHPSHSGKVVKPEKERPPSSSDKRQNEGAQGRKNATEDASKAADSPQFERRP